MDVLRTPEEEEEQRQRHEVYPQFEAVDSVEDAVRAIENQKNAPQWFGVEALAARAIAVARAFGISKQAVELACRRGRVRWFKDPLREDRESNAYIHLESWAKWRKMPLQKVLEQLVKSGYVLRSSGGNRPLDTRNITKAKEQERKKRKVEKLRRVTEEFYERRRVVDAMPLPVKRKGGIYPVVEEFKRNETIKRK